MLKIYKVRCHYNSATRVVVKLYKFFPTCSFVREDKLPHGIRELTFECSSIIATQEIFDYINDKYSQEV
jgi:hypothetical protein